MKFFKRIVNNVKKEIKQATAPSDKIYYFGRYIYAYKDKESLPNDLSELHLMELYYSNYSYTKEDKQDILKDITWKANELVQNGAEDKSGWVFDAMYDYFKIPAEEVYAYAHFVRAIKRSNISKETFIARNESTERSKPTLLPDRLFKPFIDLRKENIVEYFEEHLDELVDLTCTLLEEEQDGNSIVYSGVYLYKGLMHYINDFLDDNETAFSLSYFKNLINYMWLAHLKFDYYDVPRQVQLYKYNKENEDKFFGMQKLAEEQLLMISGNNLRYYWMQVKAIKEEELIDVIVEKKKDEMDSSDEKISISIEEYQQIAKEQIALFHKKCEGPDNAHASNTVYDLLELLLSIENDSYFKELVENSSKFTALDERYIADLYDQYQERQEVFKNTVPHTYKLELEKLNVKRPWAFYTLKNSNDFLKVQEALSILEKINDIERYDKISIKMAVSMYLLIHSNTLKNEEIKYFEQKMIQYLKDAVSFGNRSMQTVLDTFAFQKNDQQNLSKYEKTYFDKTSLLLGLLTKHSKEEPLQKDTYKIHDLLTLIKNDFYSELYISIVETYRGKENKYLDMDDKKAYGFQVIKDRSEELVVCMKPVIEELEELEYKRVWALSLDEEASQEDFREALSILEEIGDLLQFDCFYLDVAKYVNQYMLNFEIDSEDYLFYESKYISYLKTAHALGSLEAMITLDAYWDTKEELKDKVY